MTPGKGAHRATGKVGAAHQATSGEAVNENAREVRGEAQVSTGRTFLLEVGSEEIPARFLPPALTALQECTRDLLRREQVAYAEVRVLGTPRRLVLICEGLALQQPDRQVTIKGPPVAIAFDAQGRPTAAASGFARKNAVDLAFCTTLEDDRGAFLAVTKTEPGRATAEILVEQLPDIILGLPFPKVMRWGTSDLEFARPLQWVVALLGEDVLPLSLGDLPAGRHSRGHRTLAADCRVEIPSAPQYPQIMAEHAVVIDPEARRLLILAGAAKALQNWQSGAELIPDPELLAEVVFLCEHPTPFVGEFGEEYFALPDEVILTALKAHQRYFGVARPGREGLLPCFVAVRDGGPGSLDKVRRGNERVLRARLADALFYWQFDQQRSPDEHVQQLATVTWIEGFGSLRDKTYRLHDLVGLLWEAGFGDGQEVPTAALRAAEICKTDLVSEMIKDGKEFTRLEGTIGAHYARQAGESAVVARAVAQHYRPRSAEDALPEDRISAVLAAADRLDTLAGCWLAGFAPTGAKDPYGLRRHSLSLLRIILAREFRISLQYLLTAALAPFATYVPGRDLTPPAVELAAFIGTRLTVFLNENLACQPDDVRAILPAHGDDPTDALRWVQALAGYRDTPDFQLLATGFKRCKNILEGIFLTGDALATCPDRWRRGGRGAKGESFQDLQEPAEIALRDQIVSTLPRLETCEAAGDYGAVFAEFSRLGPAIDRFFDTVRVNVSDTGLKRLRHAFLREIHGLFTHYADFSEVAPREE